MAVAQVVGGVLAAVAGTVGGYFLWKRRQKLQEEIREIDAQLEQAKAEREAAGGAPSQV